MGWNHQPDLFSTCFFLCTAITARLSRYVVAQFFELVDGTWRMDPKNHLQKQLDKNLVPKVVESDFFKIFWWQIHEIWWDLDKTYCFLDGGFKYFLFFAQFSRLAISFPWIIGGSKLGVYDLPKFGVPKVLWYFFPCKWGGAISNIFLWELSCEFYLKFQLAWHSDGIGSMIHDVFFWSIPIFSELTSIPANDDLFP